MLKRFGIFAMALASFGVMLPTAASAAERGRNETKVVTQYKDVRGRNDFRQSDSRRNDRVEVRDRARIEHPVIVRRTPVRYYSTPACR